MIKRILSLFGLLTAIAYPFLIFAGFNLINPRYVALTAVSIITIRMHIRGRKKGTRGLFEFSPVSVVILGLFAAIIITNRKQLFLYTPAIINTGLLITFALTLFGGKRSMVEQFARMSGTDLTGHEKRYCRKVTVVWCLFFIINIIISLFTAYYCDMKTWALYNGLIAYLLMGILFTAEFIFRHYKFRKYYGLFSDCIMKKIFPPRNHDE